MSALLASQQFHRLLVPRGSHLRSSFLHSSSACKRTAVAVPAMVSINTQLSKVCLEGAARQCCLLGVQLLATGAAAPRSRDVGLLSHVPKTALLISARLVLLPARRWRRRPCCSLPHAQRWMR